MKKILFLSCLFVIYALLVSCATKGLPTEKALPQVAQTQEPQTTTKSTSGGWEQEWEQTIKNAKKEGKVAVLSTGNMIAARTPLTKAFKDKFGIDIEFIAGTGAEVSAKLLNERRSGLYLADIYAGGPTTLVNSLMPQGALDPLEPLLILPETKDANLWANGLPIWIDKDKKIRPFVLYITQNITINTDLVKDSELKSYNDLLNPKWKGKIIMDDLTRTGPGLKWFGVLGGKVLGMDYMKQLVKQEPVVLRDPRIGVEWLAQGKAAVGISLYEAIIEDFKKTGAHLSIIEFSEGSYMTTDGGDLALINQAPHQNAAKLFANWFLTKEPQTIVSQAIAVPSARMDVPTDHINKMNLLKPGINYINADTVELLLEQAYWQKIALEIFGSFVR